MPIRYKVRIYIEGLDEPIVEVIPSANKEHIDNYVYGIWRKGISVLLDPEGEDKENRVYYPPHRIWEVTIGV